MSNEIRLDGQVAIVTGAGKGIGKAIAIALARQGAAVCCLARTAADVQSVADQIVAAGGKAIAAPADVTEADQVKAAVARTVEAFGGLDTIFINAGVGGAPGPIETMDPQVWRKQIDINLTGAFICAQAAIPALKQRGGGKIITMGSGLRRRAVPGTAPYACAKAGLWQLTLVLGAELAAFNICVNELIPGTVMTGIPGARKAPAPGTPGAEFDWFKQADDVVPLALFMAGSPNVGSTMQSFSLERR